MKDWQHTYCRWLWLGLMVGIMPQVAGQEALPTDSIVSQHDRIGRKVDSMLGFTIAPLDTLKERAVRNATEMAGHRAYLQSRSAYLSKINREWMKMFQPIFLVQYSNGSILATNQDPNSADVNTIQYNLANQRNLWYTAGLSVRFTAEDFLNRKKRASVIEWEIEKIKYEGQTQARLIRERVIMRYESLMMAAQVMVIKARQFRTNQIGYELANRAFQEGNMSYADYNGALDARLYSEIQYINSRSDFQMQYLLLKEVVGGPLD